MAFCRSLRSCCRYTTNASPAELPVSTHKEDSSKLLASAAYQQVKPTLLFQMSSNSKENTDNNVENNMANVGLTRAELQDLRDAFDLFDFEKKGSINVDELRDLLQSLVADSNLPKNKQVCVHRLLRSLEARSFDSQSLTWDDFVEIMSMRDNDQADGRDNHRKIFDLFDVDAKGYIDLNDLKRVAADLAESMPEEDLEEMVQRAAPSGKVTPEQFSSMLSKDVFLS